MKGEKNYLGSPNRRESLTGLAIGFCPGTPILSSDEREEYRVERCTIVYTWS
ncbi:MAG: hypothetical protein ACLFVP_06160 [Candidatus Bathyarchaeia archaeon]